MSAFRLWFRDHVYSRYKRVTAAAEIQAYLRNASEAKLNVGAGGNRLPGWLNVDLFPPPGVSYLNAGRRWPFEDHTLTAVLCEHMIEHVSKPVGRHIIAESFRTLKPGAKFRIVTPDLAFFAQAVLSGAPESESYLKFLQTFTKADAPINWCDAINLNFYEHGHRYIYSPAELTKVLKDVGFDDIIEMRGGYHRDALFEAVDGHPRLVGLEANSIEAFALEGRKPN